MLATPFAALVAGMVTSVHCAGMCGLLTCAAFGIHPALRSPLVYHVTRAVAYAFAGGALAAMGGTAAGWFSGSPVRWLPWGFAVLFLVIALGWEKKVPTPDFLSKRLWRWRLRSAGSGGAALLGGLTVFLPCGPLYLAFGLALLAGSFHEGAVLMGCFALGTIPLLLLAQTQLARLPLSAVTLQRVRRGLALCSAILLFWRGWSGAGGLEVGVNCPLCD